MCERCVADREVHAAKARHLATMEGLDLAEAAKDTAAWFVTGATIVRKQGSPLPEAEIERVFIAFGRGIVNTCKPAILADLRGEEGDRKAWTETAAAVVDREGRALFDVLSTVRGGAVMAHVALHSIIGGLGERLQAIRDVAQETVRDGDLTLDESAERAEEILNDMDRALAALVPANREG